MDDNLLSAQQERRVDYLRADELFINKSFNDLQKGDIFRIRNENDDKWHKVESQPYVNEDKYSVVTVSSIGE